MRALIFQILFLLITATLFGQTTLEENFSKVWCNCLDSVSRKKLNEDGLSNCFQVAANKNSKQILEDAKKQFGDTSEQSGYKFGLELYNKISISSINSCNTYYHFMDSLCYTDFKKLNKDSIKNAVKNFTDSSQIKSDDFYTQRGTMYFQVNDLESALHDFDNALNINSNSAQSIYFKAWALELKKNYDEAAILYHKLFTLTQKNDFKIFEAIAQRKKNGM